ncbi:type II toxin-antitoxin system death-on-curing family toxin [Campylobacter jejuni]|uniref:type II toxin-antitoxin system death-on-curing family toxin n=3 Tax=Campylobacter jejuni TaxID=197 RepID=UPI001EDAC92E|nr:type II toxin-antitoxin system death-on-curing family toxin [Campylobacter jejuni]MCC3076589.1 type II toxin-antitoxin system death-on-curing family toxin [Campylobacter jejuni]
MKYIELSEAIAIHEKIIEKTGGLSGYNETQIGYLASALEHIKNDDYYPTITDKITHLIFSCVKFHPFADGNKRTSIFLGMHFLDLNEDFTKEYEFIDSPTLDDIVKHKQSDEVFKVFYKKDDKIRLLRVSNMQALNRFDKLKGAMTKIILDSGFKPDK